MNYDEDIRAWVFSSLPDGYELGLNDEEGGIVNVEKIRLGSEVKYLLTKTPAEDSVVNSPDLYGYALFNS